MAPCTTVVPQAPEVVVTAARMLLVVRCPCRHPEQRGLRMPKESVVVRARRCRAKS